MNKNGFLNKGGFMIISASVYTYMITTYTHMISD